MEHTLQWHRHHQIIECQMQLLCQPQGVGMLPYPPRAYENGALPWEMHHPLPAPIGNSTSVHLQ